MKTARGTLEEIYLDGSARIACPAELVPAPGQYLLAHADASSAPLAVPIFASESTPGGFRCAPPLPTDWRPGTPLSLRGPLGRGFSLPLSARRVALVAFDDAPFRLRGVVSAALAQQAEVVLVGDGVPVGFPEVIEIQPMQALAEVLHWADYAAIDAARESLPALKEKLGTGSLPGLKCEAQVLVRTPMPCGAVAECGVCAVTLRDGWRMACKDGPVFHWKELE